MNRIYLDYAATAPLRPAAKAAMLAVLEEVGNPSSIHREGQNARFVLDDARRTVADVLNVRPERVVLTSGATEANNLALRGFAAANPHKRVAVSALEHDCVRNTGAVLGAAIIPALPTGVVDLAALEALLKAGDVGLVSIMAVNNENGMLQPVQEIATLCHRYGAVFHTDAVQAVGHMPVDVDAWGADFLSFTGHKLGGPQGVGVLVTKPEVAMQAHITGGGQERNRRAGTENLAGIAGLAAALKDAVEHMEAENRTCALLAAEVETHMPDGVRMVGEDPKAPHIRQLMLPKGTGEDAVIALDMRGFAASQGSACSSGRTTGSTTLAAMGYSAEEARRGLRLSWGWASQPGDAAAAMAALKDFLA